MLIPWSWGGGDDGDDRSSSLCFPISKCETAWYVWGDFGTVWQQKTLFFTIPWDKSCSQIQQKYKFINVSVGFADIYFAIIYPGGRVAH